MSEIEETTPDEAIEEAAEAPVSEAEPVVEEQPVAGSEASTEPEAPVVDAAAAPRYARVFVCDRGHRTLALWGQPTICNARPVRSKPPCGRQLYHITELPEQVQRALNPLKASKKASKKK